MATALILGSTGVVGSHILSTLRAGAPSPFAGIDIIARRSPPAAPDAAVPVKEHIEKDTTKWAAIVPSLTPTPSVLFSGLGTTRAIAGGFDKQYKIDHDLNVELAKAARDAGVKTYVLISSAGADPHSYLAYSKMKGEIEEHVKELGFDHTIILRPGLIVAQREQSHGVAEVTLRTIASTLGHLHRSLKDPWAQDGDTIAKAAVAAAIQAEKDQLKDKVWILGQKDIVRLGLTEWKATT